jgi:hypothetical protein
MLENVSPIWTHNQQIIPKILNIQWSNLIPLYNRIKTNNTGNKIPVKYIRPLYFKGSYNGRIIAAPAVNIIAEKLFAMMSMMYNKGAINMSLSTALNQSSGISIENIVAYAQIANVFRFTADC